MCESPIKFKNRRKKARGRDPCVHPPLHHLLPVCSEGPSEFVWSSLPGCEIPRAYVWQSSREDFGWPGEIWGKRIIDVSGLLMEKNSLWAERWPLPTLPLPPEMRNSLSTAVTSGHAMCSNTALPPGPPWRSSDLVWTLHLLLWTVRFNTLVSSLCPLCNNVFLLLLLLLN